MRKSSLSVYTQLSAFVGKVYYHKISLEKNSSSVFIYQISVCRFPMSLYLFLPTIVCIYQELDRCRHVITLSTICYMNSVETDYLVNNFEVAPTIYTCVLTPVCIRIIVFFRCCSLNFFANSHHFFSCCLVNYVAVVERRDVMVKLRDSKWLSLFVCSHIAYVNF